MLSTLANCEFYIVTVSKTVITILCLITCCCVKWAFTTKHYQLPTNRIKVKSNWCTILTACAVRYVAFIFSQNAWINTSHLWTIDACQNTQQNVLLNNFGWLFLFWSRFFSTYHKHSVVKKLGGKESRKTFMFPSTFNQCLTGHFDILCVYLVECDDLFSFEV